MGRKKITQKRKRKQIVKKARKRIMEREPGKVLPERLETIAVPEVPTSTHAEVV